MNVSLRPSQKSGDISLFAVCSAGEGREKKENCSATPAMRPRSIDSLLSVKETSLAVSSVLRIGGGREQYVLGPAVIELRVRLGVRCMVVRVPAHWKL